MQNLHDYSNYSNASSSNSDINLINSQETGHEKSSISQIFETTLSGVSSETLPANGSGYPQEFESMASIAAMERAAAISEEERAIQAKNSVMWDCIGRTPEEEGYIYHFRIKPEYDGWIRDENNIEEVEERITRRAKVERLEAEMYPAVEPKPIPIRKGDFGFCSRVEKDAIYLDVPDFEALMFYLKSAEQKYGVNLTALKIGKGSGIATDRGFIIVHTKKHVHFSQGPEFLHDFFSHVKPTLTCMLKNIPRFKKDRKKMMRAIKEKFDVIEKARQSIQENNADSPIGRLIEKHIDKVEFTLSLMIDAITNQETTDASVFKNDKFLEYASAVWGLNQPMTNGYLKKRFPDQLDSETREEILLLHDYLFKTIKLKFVVER